MGKMADKVKEVIEVLDTREIQIERLIAAKLDLKGKELENYIKTADDLGEYKTGDTIDAGFKKCGKCNHILKLFLFNRNSGSKTCTTGNCKECQKASASKSYGKTKKKRNYAKYYQENKEMKQEQARKYYDNNKDEINARHKEYLGTKAGKHVMKKAHTKRAKAIANNKGIPYNRLMVIDRDRGTGEHPICYLCGQIITDVSGAACHVDHVVSIGNGGLDCFTNVAMVHHTCNLTKEKDDRNLKAEQVEQIIKLAETYIDAHPELFVDSDDLIVEE
jgi:hypothetical protein